MTAMPKDPLPEIQALITRHWGYRELRPLQEQAIRANLERRDSLVVMPTGGGKSLCFQAPAAYRTGEITVVISPLISLMKDQVDALKAAEIAAIRVDSTLDEEEKTQAARELRAGRVRLLFASPERMMTDRFQSFLKELGVRTFAIDEAHCISHWGHDFRPEYRQLASIREKFPEATFHGFTATATEQVRQDIIDQLKLRNPAVLVGNFDRPNLLYRVLPRKNFVDQVLATLERHRGQAGIIYCPSRNKVDQLTVRLKDLGYNAMHYRAAHPDESADQNTYDRKATHDAFRAGTCDLVVATVAFGMGIDRSDLRFVLHTGMPKSIEHYQQEAGRAGRDGLEAECILLHSGGDMMMWKKMAEKAFEEKRIDRALLEHSKSQLEQINSYCNGSKCRHRVLVEHFGQEFTIENCGACDLCLGEIDFEPDSTVIAQKILSCVARVGERFGGGHVASVLRGVENERILKLEHNQLSTFGLLKDYPDRAIRDWVSQLVGEELLTQTSDEYPVLKLNGESWQVMKGKRSVRLTRLGKAAPKRSQAEEANWEGVNVPIFDALRNWRRELASRNGVAPFTIFHDSSLRDISRVRPTTLDKLHQISGVGELKLKQYGAAILELVGRMSKEIGLSADNSTEVLKPETKSRQVATMAATEAFPYFREGKSVAEVAQILGKAVSTVGDYLVGFIEEKKPESIDPWVAPAVRDRAIEAINEYGRLRLKPAFLALNQEVPYETIRVVVAFMNARS